MINTPLSSLHNGPHFFLRRLLLRLCVAPALESLYFRLNMEIDILCNELNVMAVDELV